MVSLLSSLLISPEYKPRIVSWFCASDIFWTIIGTVVVDDVEVDEEVDDVEVDEEVDDVDVVVEIDSSETVSFSTTDNKLISFWEELLKMNNQK